MSIFYAEDGIINHDEAETIEHVAQLLWRIWFHHLRQWRKDFAGWLMHPGSPKNLQKKLHHGRLVGSGSSWMKKLTVRIKFSRLHLEGSRSIPCWFNSSLLHLWRTMVSHHKQILSQGFAWWERWEDAQIGNNIAPSDVEKQLVLKSCVSVNSVDSPRFYLNGYLEPRSDYCKIQHFRFLIDFNYLTFNPAEDTLFTTSFTSWCYMTIRFNSAC